MRFFMTTIGLVYGFLTVLGPVANATPTQSIRMISDHNYNISNSLKAVANNYNIKETWFVDSKSVCRHLGIVKGAVDAAAITIRADGELKKIMSFSDLESNLATLKTLISQTTSYCGRNYAMETEYNANFDGNNNLLISQMKIIVPVSQQYFKSFRIVDKCVSNQGPCS